METQVCKDCGEEKWAAGFKRNETTGLLHALCNHCIAHRREEHNAKREYYFR